MSEVAAVSIGHHGKNPRTVLVGFKRDLRDAREIFSNLKFIIGNARAEAMDPNLLKEIEVRFRFFAWIWIPSVKNGCAITRPGCAAAGGGELDARNFVLEFLAAIG